MIVKALVGDRVKPNSYGHGNGSKVYQDGKLEAYYPEDSTGVVTRILRKRNSATIALVYVKSDDPTGIGEMAFAPKQLDRI